MARAKFIQSIKGRTFCFRRRFLLLGRFLVCSCVCSFCVSLRSSSLWLLLGPGDAASGPAPDPGPGPGRHGSCDGEVIYGTFPLLTARIEQICPTGIVKSRQPLDR